MTRTYFMTSERIGFSTWTREDEDLARLLWGDREVTHYICASGVFSDEEILERLQKEIDTQQQYQVQYWPIFTLAEGELIGCCGLRPHGEKVYELGFHLRPSFWHQGYAAEAARTVIAYAFENPDITGIFAGHHPENAASAEVLKRVGLQNVGSEYYPPTGLYHPAWFLPAEEKKDKEPQAERVKATDIDALLGMRIAYLQEEAGLDEETEKAIRQPLRDYLSDHLDRDLFCYALRSEGEIVSCAFLLVVEKPMSPSFPNGRTGTVLNVYTRPAYRRRNYSRRVMEKLLAEADGMHLSSIEIKATRKGAGLYRSLGFVNEKEYIHMKRKGEKA